MPRLWAKYDRLQRYGAATNFNQLLDAGLIILGKSNLAVSLSMQWSCVGPY